MYRSIARQRGHAHDLLLERTEPDACCRVVLADVIVIPAGGTDSSPAAGLEPTRRSSSPSRREAARSSSPNPPSAGRYRSSSAVRASSENVDPNSQQEPVTPAPTSQLQTPIGTPAELRTPYSSGLHRALSTPTTGRRNDLGGSQRVLRRAPRSSGPSSDSDLHNLPHPSTDGMEHVPSEVEQTFVWGTNVNINDVETRFRRFIVSFEDPETFEALYPTLLREMVENEEPNINLDCQNLHQFDEELYKQLVAYPQEIIPIMDVVINDVALEMLVEMHGEGSELPYRIQVRTFNMLETKHMRDLNPSDIDQMVSIRGMVTRTTGIIPDLKQAYFKCLVCQYPTPPVYVDRGRIMEPTRCPREECKATHAMQMVHNRCLFANKQHVKMQETPDAIPEGETPHTVSMCVFDDLVDVAKPGDNVVVTGVYRAVPVRVSGAQRNLRSIYRTYVDVIHVRKDDDKRYSAEDTSVALDSEFYTSYHESDMTSTRQNRKIEAIKELAQKEDIYERLVASVAPSIWELDDIKRGLLCQLFGGCDKEIASTSQGRLRGEINVLLVGDPGVSKSQLLAYVHKLAPRGIYTSGKGSSAVGLTAYVTKDPDSKEMVLESGALVLSDRGICCIDEFDKMSESARTMLHEVMEQQTVSVAKAGIICSLNARTSVLASANPIGSRYNPKMSVVENIDLPPTLLSRFDLIYLVLDKADEKSDRRLAKHLVSLHYKEPPETAAAVIPISLLTDYVSYAKSHCQPKLSDEAAEMLIEGYVDMRRLGGSKKIITATPRQLEALVRLSEALARMRLSEKVERKDVAEAMRLMKSALQQAAMDPRTGTIDMDVINTGISASTRMHKRLLADELKSMLLGTAGNEHSIGKLVSEMTGRAGTSIPENEVREALRLLQDDEFLVIRGDTVVQVGM